MLDLYPADRTAAPVVVFVHGAGFVGGDKAGDETFYANVGRYFSAHGFMTAVINYRLAGPTPGPRVPKTWPLS